MGGQVENTMPPAAHGGREHKKTVTVTSPRKENRLAFNFISQRKAIWHIGLSSYDNDYIERDKLYQINFNGLQPCQIATYHLTCRLSTSY